MRETIDLVVKLEARNRLVRELQAIEAELKAAGLDKLYYLTDRGAKPLGQAIAEIQGGAA